MAVISKKYDYDMTFKAGWEIVDGKLFVGSVRFLWRNCNGVCQYSIYGVRLLEIEVGKG